MLNLNVLFRILRQVETQPDFVVSQIPYCQKARSRPKAGLRAPRMEGEADLRGALNAYGALGSHEIVGEFPSDAGYATWR